MGIKKGLKNLNPTNLSSPEGTKIYANDSLTILSHYYVHTIGDYGMNVRWYS